MKTLPQQMEDTQLEIDALKAKLADPDLFQKDPAKFNATATQLTELETAMGDMEEEWLRLEMLREEIEG